MSQKMVRRMFTVTPSPGDVLAGLPAAPPEIRSSERRLVIITGFPIELRMTVTRALALLLKQVES